MEQKKNKPRMYKPFPITDRITARHTMMLYQKLLRQPWRCLLGCLEAALPVTYNPSPDSGSCWPYSDRQQNMGAGASDSQMVNKRHRDRGGLPCLREHPRALGKGIYGFQLVTAFWMVNAYLERLFLQEWPQQLCAWFHGQREQPIKSMCHDLPAAQFCLSTLLHSS